VSFDGSVGGRRRRFANGAGSHDAVVEALRLLRDWRYRRVFRGILATVDLEADPIATYEELAAFEPPGVDFLLPHGNWTSPPPGHTQQASLAPYGNWLAQVFDRWYDARPCETDVRLFSEIIHLLLGGRSRSEAIGLSPACLVVVETDGSLEQVDSLKSAYPGAAATGMAVAEHSFDDVLYHPGIVARQIGLDALAPACRACPVRNVCGGGYYPHRYRAGAGFRNPSVYCPDLLALIGHIRSRVARDVITVASSVR
jgi:uncharacterized protein